MSEEEFRKIAKEYAEMYFTKGINSTKIFYYVDELEKKVEQLENIRKEIKEYIEKNVACFKNGDMLVELNVDDLLNILNKGDNNVKDKR